MRATAVDPHLIHSRVSQSRTTYNHAHFRKKQKVNITSKVPIPIYALGNFSII